MLKKLDFLPSFLNFDNKTKTVLFSNISCLLSFFAVLYKSINEIKCIEFDHTDVVRHPLVSKIIQAYQKKSNDKN